MKRTNVNNGSRLKLAAIAIAAMAISACGGGSGGGGGFPAFPISSAPPPAAEPAPDSSAPCFNEADFREGTLVEFDAVKPGADPATAPFHRKSVTEGREAFGGANPIAFNVDSKTVDLPQVVLTTVQKEYKDLVGGSILLYGKATIYKSKLDPKFLASLPAGFSAEEVTTESQVFAPPFAFPVDMKAGQVVSQRTSVAKTTASRGGSSPTTSVPANAELTYHGREALTTPLGTFNTCKLSLKITVGSSVITKDTTKEFWLAADGPYRGQLLKGLEPKAPLVVTKMTYTPK